jgi:ATP-binding cassette subfamily C protein LapB
LLIETLGGLETLKACGAESERQYQWEHTNGAITRLDAHARNLSSLATQAHAVHPAVLRHGHHSRRRVQHHRWQPQRRRLVASYMLGSRVLAAGRSPG